jgi:hypothetical protein
MPEAIVCKHCRRDLNNLAFESVLSPGLPSAMLGSDGVRQSVGRRPDQRAEPAEPGPAEKQVEQEDRQRVFMTAKCSDDRREEVSGDQHDDQDQSCPGIAVA